MQEIQQILMPWLLYKTFGSCKEKQTGHRNPRSHNKKRNVNSNKWHNNNNNGKGYTKEKCLEVKKHKEKQIRNNVNTIIITPITNING